MIAIVFIFLALVALSILYAYAEMKAEIAMKEREAYRDDLIKNRIN